MNSTHFYYGECISGVSIALCGPGSTRFCPKEEPWGYVKYSKTQKQERSTLQRPNVSLRTSVLAIRLKLNFVQKGEKKEKN